MTPEAQRIAIAEACGITVRADLSGYCNDHRGCADWNVIPDYLSDLNTMHEAEKTLTPAQCCIYDHVLADLRNWIPNERAHVRLWHATASQRAEAFLRTLNLWDDNK